MRYCPMWAVCIWLSAKIWERKWWYSCICSGIRGRVASVGVFITHDPVGTRATGVGGVLSPDSVCVSKSQPEGEMPGGGGLMTRQSGSCPPLGTVLGIESVQFSSVAQSCLTLCDPMDYSTPGFPVLHHLPEFGQTHVRWVRDAVQPSHPLLPPSPFAFSLSQHQSLLCPQSFLEPLFQWVSSSQQVAKVLELQHQSFQCIFRAGLL